MMGPKEVNKAGRAHPNPCVHTTGPHNPSLPLQQGQESLQGSAILAGLVQDPPALGAVLVWIGAVVPGPCMCMVS